MIEDLRLPDLSGHDLPAPQMSMDEYAAFIADCLANLVDRKSIVKNSFAPVQVSFSFKGP